MRRTDRNRLDRPPTPGERWLGIGLSALIALVCLPLAVGFLFMPTQGPGDRIAPIAGIALFGALGVAGAFFFYRAVCTKPGAASPKAQRIYAYSALAIAALTVVGTFVTAAPVTSRALAVTLLCVAVGNLVRITAHSYK